MLTERIKQLSPLLAQHQFDTISDEDLEMLKLGSATIPELLGCFGRLLYEAKSDRIIFMEATDQRTVSSERIWQKQTGLARSLTKLNSDRTIGQDRQEETQGQTDIGTLTGPGGLEERDQRLFPDADPQTVP